MFVERAWLTPETIDDFVKTYEQDIGPLNGAKVAARAWIDPAFKRRLLADGTAAIAELGFGGAEGGHLIVVENTDDVHNVTVCTLCSCYPWPVLGLPPEWYTSPAYRSRMVREPRALLAEMGCLVPDDVEIRVWDSSAEARYLVLSARPAAMDDLALLDHYGLGWDAFRRHLVVAIAAGPDGTYYEQFVEALAALGDDLKARGG
jgi:nitrile hydratase